MSDIDIDEICWLGGAVISSQKLEFAIYGIISHMSHTPAAQKQKRFKELTPEQFLRGDIKNLKATLGQLIEVFGDQLNIKTAEFDDYVITRNLIIHNYWRITHTNFRDDQFQIEDKILFLRTFVEKTDKLTSIIRGLLTYLKIAAATKEDRLDEITLSETNKKDMAAFQLNAAKFAEEKSL